MARYHRARYVPPRSSSSRIRMAGATSVSAVCVWSRGRPCGVDVVCWTVVSAASSARTFQPLAADDPPRRKTLKRQQEEEEENEEEGEVEGGML